MAERPLAGQARVSYPKAGTAQERATPNTIPYSQFFSSKNLSSYSESRNQRPRISVFEELDVDAMPEAPTGGPPGDVMHEIRPSQPLHTDSFSSVQSDDSSYDAEGSRSIDNSQNGWFESWQAFTSSRLMMLSLILLVTMPLLYDTPLLGKAGPSIFGAAAGVIETPNIQKKAFADKKFVVPRANTDTDVCKRWSHQSALVNGTLYLYGGRATKDASQSTNEWNNDFLTIDVTKSWDISSPVNAGLPQPSGPPPVSNGYLWNSYKSLFLYGGEFQDQPATTPVAYSLWEYSISSASWIEHQKPQTSNGNSSDGGNQPVMGLAEGAGVSVPQLGRGYYFGGHQDAYTTPGWSVQTERLYLKSLLELTFPGYTNNGVQSLSGGKLAGNDGVWRNITQGGIQDTARFASRADSGLVYVPGYGVNGILVSIGGGINVTFTGQMNILDVYDIGTSAWYKQSTTGESPPLRVNPCAVAASAPDGSSTNIYMFGGQNLVPAGNQIQYSDMWILTTPSFTWIKVNTSGQSAPTGRTGHTCNIWDGQMVVVGGYTGPTVNGLGCETGFYVFDTTNLTWANNFNALSGSNPQSQQISQVNDSAALDGSYGYQVPVAVQSVIGGKGIGGATITAPAQKATEGPLATGKPITYTVTGVNGALVTETGTASGGNKKGSSGPNIAAIVAGVVAGCFAVLAAYLGFCAWVYRRQLKLYKNHVAMTQRAAAAGAGEKAAFLGPTSSSEGSSAQAKYSTDQSSRKAGSQTGSTPGNSGWGPVPPLPYGAPGGLNSTANSSTEDLIGEPSFVGVLLNPRRSLRVVNRD